jgi:hypothetical protein
MFKIWAILSMTLIAKPMSIFFLKNSQNPFETISIFYSFKNMLLFIESLKYELKYLKCIVQSEINKLHM